MAKQPKWPSPAAGGRASHGLAASLDPRIDAGEPAPGRRRSTFFFLSSFIYFF
jgi:hypothetical protein